MKTIRKTTEEKYHQVLIKLKQEIEINPSFRLTRFLYANKMPSRFGTAVQSLGVVKGYGGGYGKVYEWNDKIPVTILLTRRVIKECNKIQQVNQRGREVKKITLPKVDKTRIEKFNKVVKQEPTIKEVPTQQIGLIRKFFRWIY